jgi:hypothetical protein
VQLRVRRERRERLLEIAARERLFAAGLDVVERGAVILALAAYPDPVAGDAHAAVGAVDRERAHARQVTRRERAQHVALQHGRRDGAVVRPRQEAARRLRGHAFGAAPAEPAHEVDVLAHQLHERIGRDLTRGLRGPQQIVAEHALHADEAAEPVGRDHAAQLVEDRVLLARHGDAELDLRVFAGGRHRAGCREVAGHRRVHETVHGLGGRGLHVGETRGHGAGERDEVDAGVEQLLEARGAEADAGVSEQLLPGRSVLVVHGHDVAVAVAPHLLDRGETARTTSGQASSQRLHYRKLPRARNSASWPQRTASAVSVRCGCLPHEIGRKPRSARRATS